MKTKCLLYCTLAKPYLKKCNHFMALSNHEIGNKGITLNGKIVAECEVECEEIKHEWLSYRHDCYYTGVTNDYQLYLENKLLELSCLDLKQLKKYLGTPDEEIKKVGYALHISNLKAFDKPLELGECEHWVDINVSYDDKPVYIDNLLSVNKAPQNMMWVWYKGEKYCLISIRPQWVCKILNGEKTIEVRKKVLKEMI